MTTQQPSYLNSFGRRNGRKLRANRSALLESILPKLLINVPDTDLALEKIVTHTDTPLWFEIGFGGGEHLVYQARLHQDINFIGCEPYINGIASLLARIEKENLTNIRLYNGDARLLLEKLPDASIERLFILFPDPWPKVRHHKRRLISQEGLALFYRKLMPGGLLRIATDHEDYSIWILAHLLEFKKLKWQAKIAEDWNNSPPDWVTTRYQAKAQIEGRKAIFLNWVKG